MVEPDLADRDEPRVVAVRAAHRAAPAGRASSAASTHIGWMPSA
jgi:hypothetical protein